MHRLLIALTSFAIVLAAAPAGAQLLPPRGIGGDSYQPAQAQDPASLLLRIDRLENQMRTLTGQLEESQFAVKRLEDQLRKFQQDVEFRFQDNAGKGVTTRTPSPPPQRRGDLNENGYPVVAQETPAADALPPAGRPARRGDAFDPAANPAAPGAPRVLGPLSGEPTPAPGRSSGGLYAGPLGDEADPDAPLNLNPRVTAPPSQLPVAANPAPDVAPQVATALPAVVPARPRVDPVLPGPAPASLPVASSRDEYDAAAAVLKEGQYEAAEIAFRNFLQKYPRDRLAADATFFLGESYFRRSRPREAAEQYLKVSTDFSRSARAPEALIKLGLSLEKLGAKEQACAAYSEVGRKYPNTSAALRSTADREARRAQC